MDGNVLGNGGKMIPLANQAFTYDPQTGEVAIEGREVPELPVEYSSYIFHWFVDGSKPLEDGIRDELRRSGNDVLSTSRDLRPEDLNTVVRAFLQGKPVYKGRPYIGWRPKNRHTKDGKALEDKDSIAWRFDLISEYKLITVAEATRTKPDKKSFSPEDLTLLRRLWSELPEREFDRQKSGLADWAKHEIKEKILIPRRFVGALPSAQPQPYRLFSGETTQLPGVGGNMTENTLRGLGLMTFVDFT